MYIRWDKGKNNTFYLKLTSSYREEDKVKQEILYLGKYKFEHDKFNINFKLIQIIKLTNKSLERLEAELFIGKSEKLRITILDKVNSPYAYERYISLKRMLNNH